MADAVAGAGGRLDAATAALVNGVVRRLSGPLQLAVAGRIKSGKSTVVNALIGRRVAPTDVRECTRMVTRFRYGTVDRVEIVLVDGTRRTVPYDGDGLVPAELGVPADQVGHLDAFLTTGLLEAVTVIDTPGLGSLDAASAARTTALLAGDADDSLDRGSSDAIASAEAVLFVLTQAARADDVETLAMFHAHTGQHESTPVNAIAVLNKADLVVDPGIDSADSVYAVGAAEAGASWWPAAVQLAQAQASALRHRVAGVLPLSGLVAETSETGQFTEADADALRAVVALDAPTRRMLFYSADFFLRPDIAVPLPARERLVTILDMRGIQTAVDALLAEPTMSTGELRRRLVDSTGLVALRRALDSTFGARADAVKASVALATLRSIAGTAPPAHRATIENVVEAVLASRECHPLRLLAAASAVTSGAVDLDAAMTGELIRLVEGRTPAERLGLPPDRTRADLVAAALAGAIRWRSFATFGATPQQSRVAYAVHRSYFLLWQDLQRQPGVPE